MENVTFVNYTKEDGSVSTHAIIDRGNNEFTSMTKAQYDAQIAAQQAVPNA
jgi:hypothetical protein